MMKLLLLAPSFPSVNQPWINTHIEQLIESGVDLEIISFKKDGDIDMGKLSDITDQAKVIFVLNDPRVILKKIASGSIANIMRFIGLIFANARHGIFLKIPLKDRLRLIVRGAHFCSLLGLKKKYDLIHVHFDQSIENILCYSLVTRTPYVSTFHGLNPVGVGIYSQYLRKEGYRNARNIILNTKFAKQQAVSLGCPPGKIRIIPQAIPLNRFPFFSRKLPLDSKSVSVLTVGRLHKDKGQLYALFALRRLLAAGYSVHWVFVGSGPDKVKLERICEKLDISKQVTFISNVSESELLRVYHQSDIFVLPSIDNKAGYHVETQGVVLQEAQACGCLVVATNVGGIPECIRNMVDGILIGEKSSRAICQAIVKLVDNPKLCGDLIAAGRGNVEDVYSKDVLSKKMMDVYQGVFGNMQKS